MTVPYSKLTLKCKTEGYLVRFMCHQDKDLMHILVVNHANTRTAQSIPKLKLPALALSSNNIVIWACIGLGPFAVAIVM